MKKKLVMAVLALSTLLAACGKEAQPTTGTGNETEVSAETEVRVELSSAENLSETAERITVEANGITPKQIEALSLASADLFAKCLAASPQENILISPTSIIMALGMTENGAVGDTLSEMENVVNGGLSVQELNPLMYDISSRFNSSKDVTWNVANSVWFKDDGRVQLSPDFASQVVSYYNADIMLAPFDDSTLTDINNWVNQETFGMIPSILDQINYDSRMYLINALAFEGEWMVEYEDSDISENWDFANADGSNSTVTMLKSQENGYITPEGGIGFVRPYKGGEYSFVGILPEEGTSIADYAARLASNDINLAAAIQDIRNDQEVYVYLPEFTQEYFLEMNDVLAGLGMETAFDCDIADFSLMTSDTANGNNIYIGSVLHKTFIDVNREGTRAAAVTAVEMCDNAAMVIVDSPLYITLNRPFVYAIVDNATGLPVFLGCVNTME